MKTEYYTTAEAARILGTNPGTIRRWIHDRRLRAILKGRKYLVVREDVNNYAALPKRLRELRPLRIEGLPDIIDRTCIYNGTSVDSL